jgi:hypothetical protein
LNNPYRDLLRAAEKTPGCGSSHEENGAPKPEAVKQHLTIASGKSFRYLCEDLHNLSQYIAHD